MRGFKFLIVIIVYVVLCVGGFSALIVQQENILRTYFITSPEERIKEYNTMLSDSLFKHFVRENKDADLGGVEDYIKRYGKTSLFETLFVYKDAGGGLTQISKSGVEPVSEEILSIKRERVYPVTIAGGGMDGYLVISIKGSKTSEYEEGLHKYRAISLSLRALFFLFVFALAIIALYHNYSKKMRLARDIAETRASNDGLTGLYTHAYFVKLLQIEIEKFQIYGLPIGLVMLDVDKFKAINDDYGHVVGDKILQEVARTIKSTTRSTDICARYGGEEFSILMPSSFTFDEKPQPKSAESFLNEIRNMAERIRKNVEVLDIKLTDGRIVKVTISMGIALCSKRRATTDPTMFLEKADAALYQAKEQGRNRVYIDAGSLDA